MNEAVSFDINAQSFIGSDNVQVSRLIQSSYMDAWKVIAEMVPKTWLGLNLMPITSTTFFPDSVHGTGFVIIPDDFFKLFKFTVDGWLNSAYDAYYDSDPIAKYQKNIYTRGSVTRPVCIITDKIVNGSLTKGMDYYSLPPTTITHTIKEAIYIPVTTDIQMLNDNSNLPIDDKLVQPMVYELASMVYNEMEKKDTAKNFSDQVTSFIR